jgi:hypothetical protein
VDGSDYWIWEALSASQPRIVVIEYNANLSLTSTLIQPRDHQAPSDGTAFFGDSEGPSG